MTKKGKLFIICGTVVIISAIGLSIYAEIHSKIRQQKAQQAQIEELISDAKLVYQWNTEQCESGMKMLSSYASALQKRGINLTRCCKQRATECINRSSEDRIRYVAKLIKSELPDDYILDKFNCKLPANFCFNTHITPGELNLQYHP